MPEAKAKPMSEAAAKRPSGMTPQVVKRVHEFYEELGREEVQAVEGMEKSEQKTKEKST